MIPPIRIQLLAGAQSGLQTSHTKARLTFGREAGLDVVIDEPHLSRRHAELVCENGQWAVINRSPNGTTVNGKRVRAEQPRVLKPGDVVGVGKTRLFIVHFAPGGGGGGEVPAFDEAPDAGALDAGNRMSRRGKLWIGIGAYMLAMLVVAIVIFMAGGDDGGGGGAVPNSIAASDIIAHIKAPYDRPRNEAQAASHRQRAREFYDRTGSSPTALYDTFNHYKLALAHAKTDAFDGIDQLRYREIETKLIEKITTTYEQAYSKALNKEWIGAENQLRELLAIYPVHDSPLYENVNALLAYVLANQRR